MPRRPARTVTVTLVTATLAAVLGGCGLRLETPPPQPPVPDAAETVRQRTVDDALTLGALAAAVDHPDAAVQVLVDQVEDAATAHVDALGGVYDPGTGPDPDPTAPGPTGEDTTRGPDAEGDTPAPPEGDAGAQGGADAGAGPSGTAPTPDAALDSLVATLAETATTALTDADQVPDGAVARLLGAVAVHRLVLGERLAAAADGAAPPAERAEPWRVVPAEPTGPPSGVAASAVLPLVTAEDLAGQAWEVVAARREDDARTTAAERATAHRDRAEAWAVSTQVAGTGLDPRRTSYALPAGLLSGEDAASTTGLADLETGLADAYATLAAQAAPAARASLLAAVADATAAAAALTGRVPVLPGMPEQAA